MKTDLADNQAALGIEKAADPEKADFAEKADLETEGLAGQKRCTRQRAQTAARRQKFPSSQQKDDQSFARTATRTTKNSRRIEGEGQSQGVLYRQT